MATPASAPRRALALDALRGFAILTMCLSARIPFGDASQGIDWLPGWMYHAQEGPNPILKGEYPAGLSWVDLVFPTFLFAMGAAFPFALSRRLAKGASAWSLIPGIVQRYGLLVFFAYAVQFTIPGHWGEGVLGNLLAFAGMLALFPIFWRLPEGWNSGEKRLTRLIGWVAVAALALHSRHLGDAPMPWADWLAQIKGRVDMIILVLANMALFGSLIWLITRRSWTLRLLFCGLGLLGHFSMVPEHNPLHITAGWLGPWLNDHFNAVPVVDWFFKLLLLKYLITVLPGTIIGDMLLKWMNPAPVDGARAELIASATRPWSNARLATLLVLCLAVNLIALAGYQARFILTGPFLVILALWGNTLVMLGAGVRSDRDDLLANLWLAGSFALCLGVWLEGYEGGIRKTPSTLSYYVIPLALAIFQLIALTIYVDGWHRRFGVKWLIASGQNPMLAYTAIRGLLGPFYFFTGIDKFVTIPIFQFNAWAGAAWGYLKTLSLAWAVAMATRLKVFWRT